MQKRVVYNFNAQSATETATGHANGKAVKASNAIGKIKRAFFGKGLKLAVFVVLLFASLFCAIGSADWIISQQKDVPNAKDGTKTFNVDDFGLDKYISISNSTYNENPVCADMKTNAVDEARGLPDKAIDKANIKYKVIPYNKPNAQSRLLRAPQNAASTERNKAPAANAVTSLPNEDDFKDIDYVTELPTKAGTYAVLITSVVGVVSYGKAIKVFTIAPCPVKIEWSGAVDFIYDGADHLKSITATAKTTDGTTIDGIVTKSFTYKAQGATTSTEVTEVKNAGTYTATAEITNPNYALAEGSNATKDFTISQKELTVKANPHQITYGDAPSTNGYEISGYANGETFESANISGTAKLTTNYTQFAKVGEYEIRVDISELSSLNYSFKPVNGILTVNKKELTVTANPHQIIYGDAPSTKGYTISGFIEGETFESANINGTVKLTTNYTQFKDVGKYVIFVDISGLSSPNYSFNAVNGILTVNKKELTVTAKPHQITYGDEPSANGYEISGFVNNENESVITGLDKITYIIDYTHLENVGQFSITPKVDELTAVNYSFKATLGVLTVNALDIQLSGITECEYDDVNKNPLLFNKDLFANATFTAPSNSTIDLSNVYTYISEAGAKNYDTTDGLAITPENGLFSYAFSNTQSGTKMAGSTYKIEGVKLDNKNFNLTETEVYLKYKTAKIDGKFYTIEEALATGGDITLCGNIDTSSASPNSSYVITAFSKLSLSTLNGNDFKDYKSNYNYTLSGKKLIASFDGSAKEEDVQSSYNEAGDVFSALVISKGITITLSSSASIIAAAEVGFNQSIATTLAKDHGVIMNNGNIVVNSGCSVTAYGYIKGNGLIQMNSGATALDALTIYDWPGGVAAMGMYTKVFPTNAYTVHNISCPTKVFSGAIYKARVFLTAKIATLNKTIVVIGPDKNGKKGMFNADSNSSASDYILKSVNTNQKDIETAKDINSNIALSNQRATGTVTTLNHRDNIQVCGKYSDAPVEIDAASIVSLKTSTSIPLPVGFMDIAIKNKAVLTLTSSDYLILPGAKLTVDNGGTLTLGNNVDLVALPYSSAPTTGSVHYTQYYTANTDGNGKKDGELIVNGTLSGSGYSLGGNISTEQAGATLNVVNASGTYITMRNSSKPYYESGTINAFGDIMISQNSYVNGDLNPGSYISTQGQDGNYYWITNDQLKTITFENDSAVLKTVSVVLEKSNDTLTPYTIKTEDLPDDPTKDYYTFDGWYVGDSKLIPGTTTITDNTVFTAKWIPNKYNIQYVHIGCTDEQLATITSDNPTQYTYNEKLILNTPTSTSPELNFMGWFSNKECTTPITEIAIGTHGNTTVYGKWTTEQLKKYTITYESGLDGVTLNITTAESTGFASGFTYKIPTIKATWDGKTAVLSPDFMNSTDLSKLVEEHHYNFSKYFVGWYIYATDGETLLDTLNETCPTIEKAQDIILKPIWKDKAVLQVSFKNSKGADFVKGNNTFGQKTKYFKPGCSISSVIISAACSEYTKNVCDFMGEQYQFTKYSTAQGNNTDITFPSDDGAIVEITSYYTRYYYINISGNGISLTGSNPFAVEPNATSFKISDKVTLSEGYEITSYTINDVDSNSDTINLRNYDPYAEINIVVNTQLKQYTLTIVQNDYSGGVTITDSTGKRYTNGDSIYHGTNITIKTNSNTKATIVYAGNSVTIKKDKSHEIKPVTSNITITADDDSGCLVEGTLITLADGTKKKVEDLKMGDILLVYNHEKGKLDASPLLVNVHAGEEKIKTNIINLKFSDGSLLRICYEHGLFDNTLNKYVYINENNYLDYLGHSFYSASWNENEFIGKTVKLVNAYITTETVKLYNPATVWHLNLFAENMLTLSAGMTNFFEYDENMKYNEELMKADIEKYGLYTYEDFKDYVSEEVFNAFPFKYFKVSVGKGEFTFEKLLWLIEYYNDSTSLK